MNGLASYTWSRSLDNASDEVALVAPSLYTAPSLDYGPSTFDRQHIFSGALTVSSPWKNRFSGGWNVDLLANALAGAPLNPTYSNSATGVPLRPDLKPGVPVYIFDPSYVGGMRINQAAFTFAQAPVRQGTLSRDALRGFSSAQLNAALQRDFRLNERFHLQLRFESFNVTNHPNFADPAVTLPSKSTTVSTTFGRSTQTLNTGLGGLNGLYQLGGPRSTQLGAKFSF